MATSAWSLVKKTFDEGGEDKIPRMAAALSYYTVLSLSPLLVVAIAIAGIVFGEDAARGQIAQQLQQVFGPEAGEAIQAMIVHAKKPSSGVIGTVVGGIVLLLGASGVFGELQESLNTIWEVAPRPSRLSHSASTRPVGPAPTIRTSVGCVDNGVRRQFPSPGAGGKPGRFRCRVARFYPALRCPPRPFAPRFAGVRWCAVVSRLFFRTSSKFSTRVSADALVFSLGSGLFLARASMRERSSAWYLSLKSEA